MISFGILILTLIKVVVELLKDNKK
ncbi:putative holin-like toxin [Lapidilactobacillus bayanensis]